MAGACDRDDGEPEAYPIDDELRVHEIQLLNTHNSYKLRPPVEIPGPVGEELDYEHRPLDVQLEDEGVRGFELDVVNTGDEFPVLHVPVADDSSNCTPFSACLQVIKTWSDENPGHAPIFVLVEPKDGVLERDIDPALQIFDAAALARLDEDIRSVFGPRQLLTPDDVRGDEPTLRSSVREFGWPTMGEARGKVVMVLNNSGDARDRYLDGRPSLEGAPMFVTAEPDAPSAAVVKVDDPDEELIAELVRDDHFIVRTRADAGTVEARANDVARRDLAFRSGAQIVSTDYPIPDPLINPDYVVQIPDGQPGRCNPVQAPADCRPVDVENPRHLR